MKHLSTLVSQILHKKGLHREAHASLIIEKMNQILSDHFGEKIFTFCTVKKYQDKKIIISTTSSSWKHTLHSYASSFLLIIQNEFPTENIEEIVIH